MVPSAALIEHENMVHVWSAPLDIDGNTLKGCRVLLSNDEQRKAARFCAERDVLHYIAARGFLRLLLAHYLSMAPEQLAFDYGVHGKPRLGGRGDTQQLEFNLSHSGSIALCAVASRRRIGVDVERQRDIEEWQSIARACLTQEELDSLTSLSPADGAAGFLKLWTQKEAYVKGLGQGLSYPLQQFCVPYSKASAPSLSYDRHDPQQLERWQFHDLYPTNGHLATVAVEGTDSSIQLYTWRW